MTLDAMPPHAPHYLPSPMRRFLESETTAGLVLIASAGVALILSNSPAAPLQAQVLGAHLGPLSVAHWINDGGMALFFLLVGAEIKREMAHGQLRTWRARALPGLAAAGGMIVPAAVYAAFNAGLPSLHGWAVPAATDIAFALGVIALLGSRVPTSLKVFLTALAVLDDLGAVVIIALAYTEGLDLAMLGLAAAVLLGLLAMNVCGVRRLSLYLLLGVPLWIFVLRSGLHATVAGVLLGFALPADRRGARRSPLDRLELGLSAPVAFLVLPLFGLANAGVALSGEGGNPFVHPVTLGIAFGLFVGKQVGVMASLAVAVKTGLARRPAGASWRHIYGVAVLCGIGFTMSLFIAVLAFAQQPDSQDDAKIGVLMGSILSAVWGALVLWRAPSVGGRASRLRD